MTLDWWLSYTWVKGVDLVLSCGILGLAFYFLKRLSLQFFAILFLLNGFVFLMANVFQLVLVKPISIAFGFFIGMACLVFYSPEFRRALDRVRYGKTTVAAQVDALPQLVKKLLTSVDLLCKEQLGALIVIEGKEALDEYIKTGIQINGSVTSDLLISLFWKGAPTHDGAVVLRFDNIVAAGCFLPLTDSTKLDQRLGTRHQAAIGLSERTDSFIIVVSEETSTISIVESGTITRYINRESLETKLFDLFNKVYQLDSKA